MADLNRKVPEEIKLNRFRPNIVVAGSEPWAEDRWQVRAGCLNPEHKHEAVCRVNKGRDCW